MYTVLLGSGSAIAKGPRSDRIPILRCGVVQYSSGVLVDLVLKAPRGQRPVAVALVPSP